MRRRSKFHLARPRTRRRSRRIAQLARRWTKRLRRASWRGYSVGIRKRSRRRPIHRSAWSWSGRRGSVDILKRGHLMATNPRHRRHRRHRRSTWALRLNPSVGATLSDFASPVTHLPQNLKRTFSGKGLLINSAFAVGGAVGALTGGNMLQGLTISLLGTYGPTILANDYAKRAFGAGHALLVGGVAAKFLPVKADQKLAILAGTGAATVMELVFPGMMATYLAMIPGLKTLLPQAAMAPVSGIGAYLAGYRPGGFLPLGGYVTAPGYQGVGGYVTAPGYQGVGRYAPGDALAGYVTAPGYQGVGGLKGLGDGTTYAMGSNMPSFLDAWGAAAAGT